MKDLASKGSKDRGSPPAAAPVTEEALLRLYANGDPEAARELVGLLGPRAYSVALRVLGNRAEAEDVMQEAMLRLWRIAPEWQSGQAKVSTWLYRVVMNLCLDLRRRRQALALDGIPEPEDGSPAAMDRMLDVARVDALQEALMTLPVRQRQAVVLRHIEELSNPEIAGIMEIGVEAVESLTARGKRTLAAVLAGRKDELGYHDDG
ncbi:RNA polymerase sigma factor [Ruegeria aquimaris]|uniref:RNA polymerase sigma factor n=1 Tax=Ruegeria aquimaris TaxID=2984333 RepID=A0ABT3ANF5_9RHOB|nr:RNA polymerase sigma factor [Ruegeria sp. XHP0148]MCV2890210.1 RNA polymerase sigma factor [Ruegeria sp. XHP0148]